MPPSFWHHALQMATYLHNISPTKTKHNRSPTQLLYQKDPSYSHLRVFGCLCYPLFPSTSINKLQSRSTPCVFLGYPPNHRGYKCYDLSTNQIIISRHVMFDESVFPFSNQHNPPTDTYDFLLDGLSPVAIQDITSYITPGPSPPSSPSHIPFAAPAPTAGTHFNSPAHFPIRQPPTAPTGPSPLPISSPGPQSPIQPPSSHVDGATASPGPSAAHPQSPILTVGSNTLRPISHDSRPF